MASSEAATNDTPHQTQLFLSTFLSKWTGDKLPMSKLTRAHMKVTYNARYFSYNSGIELPPPPHSFSSGNIQTTRDSGTFYKLNGQNSSFLRECRVSLALVVDANAKPHFTVMVLTDGSTYSPKNGIIHRANSSQFHSLYLLIEVLDGIVELICSNWRHTLRGLDSELSVKVSDFINSNKYDRLMQILQFTDIFDESMIGDFMFDTKPFLRSKTYFQMQQLCRIFRTIVEETIKNIQWTQTQVLSQGKRHFKRRVAFEDEFEALAIEWERHTADNVLKLGSILDLIQKKSDEVVSLRDGECDPSKSVSSSLANGR